MTRDEIQKLIGGYATGSLTESERKLLFDAALEDQGLFDQLAHEQALKELLEEPGAKQQLLTALGPEKPQRVWWNQWPWALAAAASVAVVIGVVMLRAPEKPREIAAVTEPAEPPASVVATPPQAVRESVTVAPAPPPVPKAAPRAENAPAPPVAQTAAAAPPAPAPSPEAVKLETNAVPADKIQQVAPTPPPVVNGFLPDGTPQVAGGRIQTAPPARAAAGGGGRGGGRGGKGGGIGPAPVNAAARLANVRFAFDYSFDATGALRIVPTVQGYLSVTAPVEPTPSVLFPSRMVPPMTPVIVPIPADVSELVVSFSVSPAITGSPARREEPSGTVEDQNPPNQRILVTIPVKR